MSKCSRSLISYSANNRGAHHLRANLKKVPAVMTGDFVTRPFFNYLGTERFRVKLSSPVKGGVYNTSTVDLYGSYSNSPTIFSLNVCHLQCLDNLSFM